MIDLRNIESLARAVTQALPDDAKVVRTELKSNLELALNAALTRMNLVTREEFDLQTALLQRTRMKLEELNTRLEALEAKQSQSTESNV